MTRIGELIGMSALNGQPLQPAIDAIKGIVANGHKQVLIAGVRGDNFTPPYRDHPQLVFWNSLDGRHECLTVPHKVALILVTRFIGHSVYGSLKDQAKSMGAVFVNHPLGTGQIRELLKPFITKEEAPVVEQPKQDSKPVVGQTMRGFARGELQQFVEKHAITNASPVIFELRRLCALAREQGYDVSENSMNSAYYRHVNREKGDAVVETVEKKEEPRTVQVSSIESDDAELLRMLDDAMAAMGLVRQAIVDRASKRAQLRDLLKHI